LLGGVRIEGFDCVLDAIQGDYFYPGYEMLSRGGRYVVYGAASMTPPGDSPNWLALAWKYLRRPSLDPLKMMSENKSVMVSFSSSISICIIIVQTSLPWKNMNVDRVYLWQAFNLIWMFDKAEKLEVLFQELSSLNLDAPFVGETFEFENADAALRSLQSGLTVGKVVVSCSV
jgi:NADPH:quinone reductase-like Zn-dependent oxidoreductase